MSNPFVAEIRMFAGNFAPTGWALCDGQLLPISQNTALFSLLGTTYGGDGKSNFALPNMQDSSPMHPGQVRIASCPAWVWGGWLATVPQPGTVAVMVATPPVMLITWMLSLRKPGLLTDTS